jgi:hypothetical protein
MREKFGLISQGVLSNGNKTACKTLSTERIIPYGQMHNKN